jgi:hypothetical protein
MENTWFKIDPKSLQIRWTDIEIRQYRMNQLDEDKENNQSSSNAKDSTNSSSNQKDSENNSSDEDLPEIDEVDLKQFKEERERKLRE